MAQTNGGFVSTIFWYEKELFMIHSVRLLPLSQVALHIQNIFKRWLMF